MTNLLRVVDWKQHFENNRTRELKSMGWVPLPNKHDGDGYTELIDHKDGAAHFGCWVAIVQVASRCDPRGTLLRDGARPHSASTLSRMTRIPVGMLEAAIKRLIAIGWLESQDVEDHPFTTIPQDDAVKPQEGAGIPQEGALNGREGKGRELNGTEGGDVPVKKGKHSPKEQAARELSERLGSSLDPCRKQVNALVVAGWDLARIAEAIKQYAVPGVAPWDWAKTARENGHAGNGDLSPEERSRLAKEMNCLPEHVSKDRDGVVRVFIPPTPEIGS